MFKKEITYTNFDDVEVKETFYFNLMASELQEMQLTTQGGMTSILQRIVDTKDVVETTKMFKDIILKAYGEKSDDGKHFVKSKEISERFSQTMAYDALFMEIFSDADKAAAFVNGLLPQDLVKKAAALREKDRIQNPQT